VDNLGENVTNAGEARHSAQLYHQMLDQMNALGLNANVSLKLTHMGLDVDEAMAYEIASNLVQHAVRINNFVRVDMEGSAYTDRTLRIVKEVHAESPAVGTVIQAYLYRSEADVQDLLAAGCRIRLVKGAYREPPRIAFRSKKDVDANYIKLMKLLLPSGTYHALATHDPKMIEAAIRFAAEQNITKGKFEFQMLYGIRTDLQHRLVRQGYRVRVYIPFGRDWFPYFMRRLAERPANVAFFLRNFLRGSKTPRRQQ
jgi:proline dehydrogenase